ncbi:MAG TPA: MlaD family protein [Solirubrobacteraceae bacterium]|nr:MlaD family protein [Solirubrobacteraceae bacterium]
MRRLASILAAFVAVTIATAVATSASRGSGSPYQVRAIFDDAAFAVPGEDVRVAGAPVGSIKSLEVCTGNKEPCSPYSPQNKAAVTIEIDNADFTPFYQNAHCAIRPQSLIGEKYVDCEPGTSSTPELQKITSGPGAGTYYLPLTNTSSPVDSDIVQDISQQPVRERFALILNELGTGLAARGADLNDVIHRANPALLQTDKVLKILAQQNRTLARLATESDAVLAPLARAKQQLGDFVVQANTTAVASAARAADISRSFQLFPSFLRQLRPLVADLGTLADQGTPLMNSLAQSASAVSRQFENLAPFAKAARPALIELGNESQQSQPLLLSTIPLANKLNNLGTQAQPTAALLDKLTSSLDQTGAIEYLMSLLFYGVSTTNTFDSIGHFARNEPMVGSCTSYVTQPIPGCSANFGASVLAAADAADAAAAPRPPKPKVSVTKVARVVWQVTSRPAAKKSDSLTGLLDYLIGSGR